VNDLIFPDYYHRFLEFELISNVKKSPAYIYPSWHPTICTRLKKRGSTRSQKPEYLIENIQHENSKDNSMVYLISSIHFFSFVLKERAKSHEKIMSLFSDLSQKGSML
jgi:hypothetical protein